VSRLQGSAWRTDPSVPWRRTRAGTRFCRLVAEINELLMAHTEL
jgi:hypothetical protein